MIETDLLIIGAGPAGLSAAAQASDAGANVLLLERSHVPGGQLLKQTHMFFGSENQYASYRGFDISDILLDKLGTTVKLKLNSTVLAAYDDGIWAAEIDGKYAKVKPKAVIVATGAGEKSLPFPGNDLPGICGAGAIQTLMNQYGIKPAQRVVMLGAGNIGLIVSYQLLQAGVEVLAVAEGSPKIGGYLVHASKLARMGVPILTSHTVKRADGGNKLESVTLWEIDSKWQGIAGTEKVYPADALCIAIGLSPLSELLWQAGCKMQFVSVLGGYVPYRDENMRTSIKNIFIAGDVGGIEEASAAMVAGKLSGLCAAAQLGFDIQDLDAKKQECYAQLSALRRGQMGERIQAGVSQVIM